MSGTKVITGKVRFSYAHFFKARAMDEGQDAKFSVVILIPKSDEITLGKIDRAIEAAKVQGKAEKFGGKLPANLKLPVHDGDIEKPDDEAYEGHYFINCSSKSRPEVVDRNLDEVIDATQVVSGDYGRVSINFYPFAVSGNKGIAAGLNNVQFLEKGEPLSGGSSAAEDFGEGGFEDDDLV